MGWIAVDYHACPGGEWHAFYNATGDEPYKNCRLRKQNWLHVICLVPIVDEFWGETRLFGKLGTPPLKFRPPGDRLLGRAGMGGNSKKSIKSLKKIPDTLGMVRRE